MLVGGVADVELLQKREDIHHVALGRVFHFREVASNLQALDVDLKVFLDGVIPPHQISLLHLLVCICNLPGNGCTANQAEDFECSLDQSSDVHFVMLEFLLWLPDDFLDFEAEGFENEVDARAHAYDVNPVRGRRLGRMRYYRTLLLQGSEVFVGRDCFQIEVYARLLFTQRVIEMDAYIDQLACHLLLEVLYLCLRHLCQSSQLVLREVVRSGHYFHHLLHVVVPAAVRDEGLDFEHLAVDLTVEVELELLEEHVDEVVRDHQGLI